MINKGIYWLREVLWVSPYRWSAIRRVRCWNHTLVYQKGVFPSARPLKRTLMSAWNHTVLCGLCKCVDKKRWRVWKRLLPDSFGVTVEMKDGYELGDVSHMLQVINRIIQVPLPLLVKVDQSRCTCDDMPQPCPTVPESEVLAEHFNRAVRRVVFQLSVCKFQSPVTWVVKGFGWSLWHNH